MEFLIVIPFLVIPAFYIFASETLKKIKRKSEITEFASRRFSIIIAAKNEENNLPNLLNCLKKQNYPPDLLEIIIVDDNSTDNTYACAHSFLNDFPHIKVIKAGRKILPGKKGALEKGIEVSRKEFILITDADCRPSKNWVSSFNNAFAKKYEVVFGHAPMVEGKSLAGRLSCYENLRSSILTFTMAESGFPYSAAARSFGFTYNFFSQAGGYSKTAQTLSGDDDLFIREAVKHKAPVGCFIDNDSFVFSESKNTMEEYFSQKARHTSSSAYYLAKHKAFLAGWHMLNLLPFLLLPAAFLYPVILLLPLIKFLTEIIAFRKLSKVFGYSFNVTEIICLSVFFEVSIIINYFYSFKFKTRWN